MRSRSAQSATNEREAFLLALARGLHRFGAPSHRLEGALAQVAGALGVEAQFFAQPTFLMVAFGPPAAGRACVFRTDPGATDLDKLARCDAVALEVVEGRLDPGSARRRLEGIAERPPPYGKLPTVLAYGAASGAAACFLGGGAPDLGAAAAIGLVIGALATLRSQSTGGPQVFELVAALLAALLAGLAARIAPVSVPVATVSGLIVLVPGFTLTVGLTELAMRHLASGTARLTGAAVTFLEIAVGVALGEHLARYVAGGAPAASSPALPAWSLWIALLVAAPALAVIVRVPGREIGWLLPVCALGYGGALFGGALFGPDLGAGVGAFAITAAGNLYARRLKRPSSTVIVPAIILLVPGSIGFRSLSALMHDEITASIEAAFSMSIVAASFVAGVLAANALVPPRRAL